MSYSLTLFVVAAVGDARRVRQQGTKRIARRAQGPWAQALLGVTELMGSVAKLRAEADTIELLEHAAVPAESPAPPVQERVEAGAPAGSWAAAQHDDSVHVAEVVEDHEESYAHTADADDQSETSSGDRVPAVAQAREVPAIRESDENGDSGTRPLGWLFRAAQN